MGHAFLCATYILEVRNLSKPQYLEIQVQFGNFSSFSQKITFQTEQVGNSDSLICIKKNAFASK